MRTRLLTALVGIAALIGMTAAPTAAQADEWGPVVAPGVLFYTDNSTLTYCYTTSFDSFRRNGAYAMTIIDNTTDLVSQFPTTPAFCEFRETDVWWWSSNLAAGVRGRTTCRWVADWDETLCKSDDIQMDFAELDMGSNDLDDRLKTACHELGHVVGLQHGTTDAAGSCMISGEVPNTNIQYRRYSAHHIGHINSRY